MIILNERLTFDQANMVIERITEGEGENSKKKLFMTGTFMSGGVKNLNQRVYPVSEIQKAVNSINETLRSGESVLGELDHPAELTINLDRVALKIDKMWMDGNNGMGKLQVLPTPLGEIARTLIESGVKLGVSSRGSGNVGDDGMVSDYECVTIDLVARPSAQTAFPKPTFESLTHWNRGMVIEDLAKSVIHDKKAQKYLTEELMKWINNLK